MNSIELLYWAIFVFVMMLIGLGLTVVEFRTKFGADDSKSEQQRAHDGAEKNQKARE